MRPAPHEPDRLLEYAYGELAPADAKSFESHLKGCAECTRALENIRSVRRTMGQLPTVPAPNAGLDSLLAYAHQAARRAQAGPDSRSSFWKWVLLPSSGALALVLLVVVTTRVAHPTRQAKLTGPAEVQRTPTAEEPALSLKLGVEKKAQSDQLQSVPSAPAVAGAEGKGIARSEIQPAERRESVDRVMPKPAASPARKAAPVMPLAKAMLSERDKGSAKDDVQIQASQLRGKSVAEHRSSEGEGAGPVANFARRDATEEVIVTGTRQGRDQGMAQNQGAARALSAPSPDYKQPQPAAEEEIARVRNALAKESPTSAERARLLNRLCELLYAAQRPAEAESACDQVIREFPNSPAATTARDLKAKNAAPRGR